MPNEQPKEKVLTPKEVAQQKKDYAAYVEQRRNTVIEMELNARYWKALHDVKFYTIEENKLREPYNALMAEKQKVLDTIDNVVGDAVAKQDADITAEAPAPAEQPKED